MKALITGMLFVSVFATGAEKTVSLEKLNYLNGLCLGQSGVMSQIHYSIFPEAKKQPISWTSNGISKWNACTWSNCTYYAFYTDNELSVSALPTWENYIGLVSVEAFPRLRGKIQNKVYDEFGKLDSKNTLVSDLYIANENSPEFIHFKNTKTNVQTKIELPVTNLKACLQKQLTSKE